MWRLGDYPAVASLISSAGEDAVRDARIGPGDDVLDVACGCGNATIPAAATGACVTGLDITPELLEVGRSLAPEVTWIEGDAQALPFADASFDAVLSVFGCMFAPDQALAASELRRVLRPGGELRFYEHVIGTSRRLATVQRALAPGLAKVFGGCRADRDTGAAIEAAGFRLESYRRFLVRKPVDAPAAPRILGVARRA
jgi:ubiquinone/menaquinone biosynthesis C-methylase UbiE